MIYRNALIGLVFAMTMVTPVATAATPEEEYLIDRVVENLRRLCELSATKSVKWKAVVKKRPVVNDVWNPDSYKAFLAAKAPGLRPSVAKPRQGFAEKLLNPTGPGMALAAKDLGKALTTTPNSPELHDAAAFLLCVLALREHSGRFHDLRTTLCRITAHLAFARHLSPKPSPIGALAHAFLEAFKGNARTASVMASELPAVPGDWKEILDLTVTGDWRPTPRKPSILYGFLRTKALLESTDGELSRQEVDRIADLENTVRNRTDWHRIFLADPPTRKFALNQLDRASRLEGAEIAAVLAVLKLDAPTSIDLVALMNAKAGYTVMPDPVGLPKVTVIDWGLWAEHYQRHLCHVLTYFPATHALERKFAGLDLLPFVLLQQRMKPNGIARDVLERAIDQCKNEPARITYVNWVHLQRLLEASATAGPDPFQPLPYSPYLSKSVKEKPTLGFVPASKDLLAKLRDPETWFAPAPAGSHYRAAFRFDLLDDDARAKVAEENPWDTVFIRWRFENSFPSNPSLKQLDASAASRAEYDLNVMKAEFMGLPDQGADRLTLLKRMARMSPRAMADLAREYYVEGNYEAAVQAFLTAADRKLSPLRIAAESPWMVDALKRTGRDELAMAFAEKGAQHGGSGHRVRYLERLAKKNLEDGAKRAVAMEKHFPVECPLIVFNLFAGRLQELHAGAKNVSMALGVIRHRPSFSEDERLQAFKRAEAVIFPGGRRKYVKYLKNPWPPRSRLALAKVSGQAARDGLAANDVVVAVNGTLVADVYQYHFLRWENIAPSGIITLWNPTKGYFAYPCVFKSWDAGTVLEVRPDVSVVEYRIANVKEGRLDLSGLGLSSIPKEVFALKGLTYLNLSDNPLKTVPTELTQLSSLTTLRLSNCGLSTLPDEIVGLTALKALDLSSNAFSDVPGSVGKLSTLTGLNLNDNTLTQFPKPVLGLAGLTTLLMAGNRIVSLPDGVSGLSALEVLNLGNNAIETFPETVCRLPKLKRLWLYGNSIGSLPDAVGTMITLTSLDLRRNMLTSLPAALAKAEGLLSLRLGENRLTDFPKVALSIPTLQYLDLGRNFLTELPPKVSGLTALKQLILSDNRLASLPEFLAAMPKLRVVYYGGNPIPAAVVAELMKTGTKTKFSAVTYE